MDHLAVTKRGIEQIHNLGLLMYPIRLIEILPLVEFVVPLLHLDAVVINSSGLLLIRDIYCIVNHLSLLYFEFFHTAVPIRRYALTHFALGITHIFGQTETPCPLIKELFA